MEDSIDLTPYFKLIRRKIWIILGVTLLTVSISSIITFFIITPTYEVNTALIIRDNNATNTTQVNSYSRIIKSRSILEKLKTQLNLDMTIDELLKSINISILDGTEIIEIQVKYKDKEIAYNIANSIINIFQVEILSVNNSIKISVIDQPFLQSNHTESKEIINISLSIILGFVLGIFIIFLREYTNRKIESEQDIKKYVGLEVIGEIPFYKLNRKDLK